jgi:hypothetical protein
MKMIQRMKKRRKMKMEKVKKTKRELVAKVYKVALHKTNKNLRTLI